MTQNKQKKRQKKKYRLNKAYNKNVDAETQNTIKHKMPSCYYIILNVYL